jgi:hypothetical protein
MQPGMSSTSRRQSMMDICPTVPLRTVSIFTSNLWLHSHLIVAISTLNYLVRATGFNFVLTTTTRTNNPTWFDSVSPGNSYDADMKNALHVGGPETLNIYTVGFPGSNLLGFGTFPWAYESNNPTYDGVVIQHSTVPGGSTLSFGYGF